MSNLVRTTRVWNNLHQVLSKSKIWETKIITFGSNKTKGPKYNSQNRLRLPMPEGGVPLVFIIITLFRDCKFQ